MLSLHCIEIPSSRLDAPCLLILHGLLGEGGNWKGIAGRMSDQYHRVLVDLVNHGNSFHIEERMSYGLMAEQVYALIQEHPLMQNSVVLLGHSMGGKVGMRLALEHPDVVRALIVLDIYPQTYPKMHSSILEGMLKIAKLGVATRKEAEEIFTDYEPERQVRAFILKNLIKDADGSMKWKCNVESIVRSYPNICSWEPVTGVYEGPCTAIYGTRSEYRQEEGLKCFFSHFPNAEERPIEQAGHWVHADQPTAFLQSINLLLANLL